MPPSAKPSTTASHGSGPSSIAYRSSWPTSMYAARPGRSACISSPMFAPAPRPNLLPFKTTPTSPEVFPIASTTLRASETAACESVFMPPESNVTQAMPFRISCVSCAIGASSPSARRDASGRPSHAHQAREVPLVERIPLRRAPRRERRLEALERIPPAFDVREIRREHEELRPAALDQAADVLGRVRRHADLAANVVRRPHRQLADAALGAAERVLHDLETLEPGRHPHGAELDHADHEPRELLQDLVEDQRGERDLGPVADRHVEEAGEVLAAAVEVGLTGEAVLGEALRDLPRRLVLDVEEDRDAALLAERVDRVQRRMRDRVRRGRDRRQRDALHAGI